MEKIFSAKATVVSMKRLYWCNIMYFYIYILDHRMKNTLIIEAVK